ncbi:MAG TPA: XdhC family protein [Pirellulales bacterium]|jgi:xanthine dehydrogenase accessory factor|nr:XdhC family protein [Pirellulales bacterium]
MAMQKLLTDLVDALSTSRPVVYCRLVETRGSTPQKAGAAMLVFADGSQAGTLGGGCVEAEVKRKALANLDGRRAEVAAFQLDSDYGWDDGLICGGRMQILIEPLTQAEQGDYFRAYLQLLQRGEGCCEAVVFDPDKSGLASPACYLFDAEQRLVAADLAANRRAAPSEVVAGLPPLADRPRARAEHGIAYLPALPRCRLLIVGGGHIGQAVGAWASDLGFDVWVVDDREEYVNPTRFPRAERLICGEIAPTLKNLEITPNTYCIIVTRGHNHDEEALFQLVNRQARYVGLIGSRRKIKLIFDDLEAEGVSPEALAKVYAPLGIDIGSQTVPEIAVSILAELISHRNSNGQVPGRRPGEELGVRSEE